MNPTCLCHKCDHRILVGVPVYLCPKCDWRVRLGLDLGMDWLPPCSVCGSQMEGVRIIKKESE